MYMIAVRNTVWGKKHFPCAKKKIKAEKSKPNYFGDDITFKYIHRESLHRWVLKSTKRK